MKRLFSLLLLLSLLLCSCTQVPPPAVSAPQDASPQAAQQTQSISADVQHTAVWPPQTRQEAISCLCGSWHCYQPGAFSDVLWFDFLADGTYTASADSGAGLWGWSEDDTEDFPVYTYCGTWSLEEWDDAEMPYLLRLSLTETDDPAFAGWDSLGDYLFREISLCDGELLAEFIQANNGDGLYTRYFMGLDFWALEKADERPLTQSVRKNDTFCAQIWKMDYEPVYYVYADDVVIADDGTLVNDLRESVRYEVLSGVEETCGLSGGPDGLFALGEDTYILTTDENGVIVSAQYVPHGPAPSEEDALFAVSNTDDALALFALGMRAMYEGWGQLDGNMYCAYVTLGTDRADQFVREVRYAIGTDGFVYRYDALTDEWNWVE